MKINRNIIIRFFLGQASKNDREAIDHSEEVSQMLQEQWNAHQANGTQAPDSDKIWAQIMTSIDNSEAKKKGWLIFVQKPYFRIAATILVPLLAGVLVFFLLFYSQSTKHTNQRGVRSEIILPDNSKVWLNAESTISHQKTFDDRKRIVHLKGEAFFDVKHNAGKPFIVKTGAVDITVLGTSFNVMAYEDNDRVETTLVKGAVSINGKKLRPGEQAVFYKKSKKTTINMVNTDIYTSWREGKLMFDNQKLSTICKKLERWYDVDIAIDSNLQQNYRYTLTIRNETIDEVMRLLELTSPVRWKRRDNRIKISKSTQ